MAIDGRVRAHLETAKARAAISGEPVVVTVAQSASAGTVDPLAMAIGELQSFSWSQPDLDVTIVSQGEAWVIEPSADSSCTSA